MQILAGRYLSQGASHRYLKSYFQAQVKHVKHSVLSSPCVVIWQVGKLWAANTRCWTYCWTSRPQKHCNTLRKCSKNIFPLVLQSSEKFLSRKRWGGCKAPSLQQAMRWVEIPAAHNFHHCSSSLQIRWSHCISWDFVPKLLKKQTAHGSTSTTLLPNPSMPIYWLFI